MGLNHLIVIQVLQIQKKSVELFNVSYDPTRELYDAFNQDFIKKWKDETGQEVIINNLMAALESREELLLMGWKLMLLP